MFKQTKRFRGFAGWRLLAGILILAGLVAMNEPWIRASHNEWSNDLVYEQLVRIQNAKLAYMVDKDRSLDDEVTLDELLRHAIEIEARIESSREEYERLMEARQSGLDITPSPPFAFRGTLAEEPFFAMPGKLVVGKLGELPKYVTEDGREIVADYEAIWGKSPEQVAEETADLIS